VVSLQRVSHFDQCSGKTLSLLASGMGEKPVAIWKHWEETSENFYKISIWSKKG